MAIRRHLELVLAAGACIAFAALTSAAQGPAPCSVAPTPDPCGTTPTAPSKPSAAQKFPFPGESGGIGPSTDSGAPSIGGVPQAPAAPDAPASATPAAPDTPTTPTPAAKKDFPFPGDAPNSSGSGSSSSSSSDDSTPADPNAAPGTAPALTDKGSEGTDPARPGRHLLHRVNPIATKLQTDDERETEDLNVAHYYVQTGDLQGAFLRSQDAVKIAPDDPDAHFMLAELALKLNKPDIAIAEYNACLKNDPTDKEAKDARKALARLKP